MYSSTGPAGRIPAKLFYAVNISKSLPKRNRRSLQRFRHLPIGSTAMRLRVGAKTRQQSRRPDLLAVCCMRRSNGPTESLVGGLRIQFGHDPAGNVVANLTRVAGA